jgi:hypothetical protein
MRVCPEIAAKNPIARAIVALDRRQQARITSLALRTGEDQKVRHGDFLPQ